MSVWPRKPDFHLAKPGNPKDPAARSGFRPTWTITATVYDPVKVGSIDGTGVVPHDHGLVRALQAKYKPNKRVKGDPECTLFVGRLNPGTNEETLLQFFNRFGTIRKLRLVRDFATGSSRRYAFVEYSSKREMDEAYDRSHGTAVDGYQIVTDKEHERLLKNWIPRRLGGGFGGKKESGQLRFGCRSLPWKKPRSWIPLLT